MGGQGSGPRLKTPRERAEALLGHLERLLRAGSRARAVGVLEETLARRPLRRPRGYCQRCGALRRRGFIHKCAQPDGGGQR